MLIVFGFEFMPNMLTECLIRRRLMKLPRLSWTAGTEIRAASVAFSLSRKRTSTQ